MNTAEFNQVNTVFLNTVLKVKSFTKYNNSELEELCANNYRIKNLLN